MNEPAAGAVVAGDEALPNFAGPFAVEHLRAIFDHWRIFTTNGKWYALRSGHTSSTSGPESLLRACLWAGTLEGLGMQLCMQHWLSSLSAERLREVWQQVVGTAVTHRRDASTAVGSQP
jgi:hypothetical protein